MTNSTMKTLLTNQKGLSLPEILISLTLLALAGTFIVSNVIDSLEEGKQNSVKIQIKGLGEALLDYRRRCGRYPTTEQGLDALLPGGNPECKRLPPGGIITNNAIPVDPWQNEFLYESNGRTYTIISYGADGMEGGEGPDADVSSENL